MDAPTHEALMSDDDDVLDFKPIEDDAIESTGMNSKRRPFEMGGVVCTLGERNFKTSKNMFERLSHSY